ncbi:hypothetical protein WG907_10550 [Sphingobium sp. AN558]|uniref:hypothetical protein n=1 Tax=Sphingobium sp. AN558 TaxID=3133442 RepID=UPI0030BE86CC
MLDAALNLLQFEFQRRSTRFSGRDASVPQIAKHLVGHLEHFTARLHRREQRFKLRFDHIAPDRLAVF